MAASPGEVGLSRFFLIIKDRASIVNMLAEIIKGKPCTPISQPSDVEAGDVKKEPHLDQ